MKKTISLVADKAFSNKGQGYLINGELHIAPELFTRIYNDANINYELLLKLVVIDIDEMIYLDHLDEMIIFAGQQVKVSDTGHGTITHYPYQMQFEYAEVMMHYPDKGKVSICQVNSLMPILEK